MSRKQKKPESSPDAINKSAHPLKRRRPIRTFNTYDKDTHKFIRKNDFRHIRGRIVQDRSGDFWIHVTTAETDSEKQRIESLLKKDKKEYKIVRNGTIYEFFIMKEY